MPIRQVHILLFRIIPTKIREFHASDFNYNFSKLSPMKTLVLILVFGIQLAQAQAYQQRVDYIISCVLDDRIHQLSAAEKIIYHNNSSDTLSILKIHTWMNAFGQNPSPYSTQLAKLGISNKLTLSKTDQGGYVSLSFYVKGKTLEHSYEDQTHEIIILNLFQPIPPGTSDTIEVSFLLDLPKNISRGGHLDQSYQLTQWYPKVALYDSMGWHTMHYLEFGEFFNDFGTYDITVSLPSNYVVASTGTLQNEEEKKILLSRADSSVGKDLDQTFFSTPTIPPSSSTFKTLQFIANDVIDFAWFADKRFRVGHVSVPVAGKSIELWTFFLPRKISPWPQATKYGAEAIQYFSSLLSPYPYTQASLVECDRDASDAMEYPMITLIDKGNRDPQALERVIVHEIGHNWFQAILASDERSQPWMDEGLVTYYEHRYFRNKPGSTFLSGSGIFTLNTDYEPVHDYLWYLQASQNSDASSNRPIIDYSIKGYVESIYEKPAKGFYMIEKTLGQSDFDAMMKDYYETWKFKHPQSHNIIEMLKKQGISWYDSLYILSNSKIDIKISASSKPHLYFIRHDYHMPAPVEITGYHRSNKIFSTVRTIHPFDSILIVNDSIQYLILDPDFLLPEIRRVNNIVRISPTPFAPKKNQIHLIPGIGHSLIRDYYVSPAFGINFYDGFFAGIAVHNLSLPVSPLRFAGMVGYGFKSKKPVALAVAEYVHPFASSRIRQMSLDLELRNFSFYRDHHYLFQNRYFKVSPRFRLMLAGKTQNDTKTECSYRPISIFQSIGVGFNFEDKKYIQVEQHYTIHELRWHRYQHQSIHAFDLEVIAEKSKNFAKIYAQSTIQIPYPYGNKKYGELRWFAGLQAASSNNIIFSSFQLSGLPGIRQFQQDYKMDELMLGRSEMSNSLSQQVFLKDAGFNTVSDVVSSDTWMIAGSYRSSLPGFLPLRPYIQFALSPGSHQNVELSYSSGISITVLKNILEINFPALESKNITQGVVYQSRNSYLRRCTFLFDIKGLSPIKWIKKVSE